MKNSLVDAILRDTAEEFPIYARV